MKKRFVSVAMLLLLVVRPSAAIDPEAMTPAENLAFRTYVASVRLQAMVAECKSKLPTWDSEFPGAMNGWLKRNDGSVRAGRVLFENLVSAAALESKRAMTTDDALEDIRKMAVKEIASFSTDHLVTSCLELGEELRKEDSERK